MSTRAEPKSTNIKWHHGLVSRDERTRLNGHRGVTLWFTGLSGSGKSTLARRLEQRLTEEGIRAYVLDGDNVRHGLCTDLGFSPDERQENIRRVGEVARLFCDAGMICVTAFIAPYARDRDLARSIHPEGDFIEVFVNCPLATCESRDPKGLYARARAGEIQGFTGISAPYEAPPRAELELRTDQESVDECADRVIALLRQREVIGLQV